MVTTEEDVKEDRGPRRYDHHSERFGLGCARVTNHNLKGQQNLVDYRMIKITASGSAHVTHVYFRQLKISQVFFNFELIRESNSKHSTLTRPLTLKNSKQFLNCKHNAR